MTKWTYNTNDGTGCFIMFFIIWLFCLLFSLSLLGGIIYVAWHFIQKFW